MSPRSEAPAVPLDDADAEQAVVGCALAWPGGVEAALDAGLGPEHFHQPKFGRAYAAACALWAGGEAVDVVTVAARAAREGLPGPSAVELAEAVADAPAVSRAGDYAAIVLGLARRRALLGALLEATETARGPGTFEDVAGAIDALVTEVLTTDAPSDEAEEIGPLADRVLSALRAGTSPRLATGFPDLDRVLSGGLAAGALVVIGARTAVGKSALALGCARHVAERGTPVLFVSAEMAKEELAERALVDAGRVPSDRVRPGPIAADDMARLDLAGSALQGLPLVLDDRSRTLDEVSRQARRMARRGGIGLVVVDYLQLLDAERGERREREIADLSRALKRLARDLSIPVVALSQINRAVELRADKRPTLADLRESGAIEQDADVVLFIYRDELYDPASPDAGTAELHVAKHRNGPTGTIKLAWLGRRMSFANLLSTEPL
ncbi:MAG: replicative DNA helicase [Acidimicrobiales bacterium]